MKGYFIIITAEIVKKYYFWQQLKLINNLLSLTCIK